ncbi:hypothetical protein ACFQO1_10905 [Jejudonia soesokkakensis]|uniref:Uncharacterized protein n=1 Tax=Jejudonia soesokkakensis TaxID=1323432 RepID=A0ABW2MTE3_9FLAO
MTTTNRTKDTKNLLSLLASAIVFALLLGFIDEGYYNFNFLKDPGSIIALLIYGTFIFLCQYLVYGLFFKKAHFKGKLLVSIFFGIMLGLVLALLFFFSFKYWAS